MRKFEKYLLSCMLLVFTKSTLISLNCDVFDCKGTTLTDIPDFDNQLPLNIVENKYVNKLYDHKGITSCLRNKTLCIYGDSLIEETIHDIMILLSGIGADKKRIHNYLQIAAGSGSKHKITLDINDITIALNEVMGANHHRTYRAFSPQINFTLRHNFTGHRNPSKNLGGIRDLTHNLAREAKVLNECDIIVLNSAQHDIQRGSDAIGYQYDLEDLFSLVSVLRKPNSQVFWKGNIVVESLQHYHTHLLYNCVLQKVLSYTRNSFVQYINTTYIYTALPPRESSNPHIGGGDYDIRDHYPNSKYSLMWSSAVTQVVLNHICQA